MVKQLSCVGFWVVGTFPGDLALSYSKFSKSTLQQGKQSKVVPICGSHWGFTVFNHAFAILGNSQWGTWVRKNVYCYWSEMFTAHEKKIVRICGWFCGQLFTFPEQRSNGISHTTFFATTQKLTIPPFSENVTITSCFLAKHIAALFNRKKFTINITCSVHILHIQSSTTVEWTLFGIPAGNWPTMARPVLDKVGIWSRHRRVDGFDIGIGIANADHVGLAQWLSCEDRLKTLDV